MGIRILFGAAVFEACGGTRVRSVRVGHLRLGESSSINPLCELTCDTIATSGGKTAAVHLACHTGMMPKWNDQTLSFNVDQGEKSFTLVGSVNGLISLKEILAEGQKAGISVSRDQGFLFTSGSPPSLPDTDPYVEDPPEPLFLVPHTKIVGKAPNQFVDFQLDVTAANIEQAAREGFESIEHVKRYTALGFGTDQGKLSNVNGMAIVASATGRSMGEVGSTAFRPNYAPVSFGSMVGRDCADFFEPCRYTPLHSRHVAQGALFEDVGQWKRPWYFPKSGESINQTLARECLAVRQGVGILDASTLGKIDIQGPDSREFLNRIYTNSWSKLAVGRCKYGLMCTEDGMVFDDGVTACLGDQHFLMTTTTGGASRVLEWLESWLQTEWPDLRVFCNSVTDHWATIALSGPLSRELLAEITTEIDLVNDKLGFMEWQLGKVAGIPSRVFRISFTGELSYEINVQADHAITVWDALMSCGEKYGICPYGTEAMHILRAEKGFIIVGQDTDGSVTPMDLGLDWAVARNKPFCFLGERGMDRADCVRTLRKQLVGLHTIESDRVLPEGAQIVFNPSEQRPLPMAGHVTSSYLSPILGRSIALALVEDGNRRMGDKVHVDVGDHKMAVAEICSPVFYDPERKRQNV